MLVVEGAKELSRKVVDCGVQTWATRREDWQFAAWHSQSRQSVFLQRRSLLFGGGANFLKNLGVVKSHGANSFLDFQPAFFGCRVGIHPRQHRNYLFVMPRRAIARDTRGEFKSFRPLATIE